MHTPTIVDHDTWLARRKALLEREKAFTREREALARARRELPWERVEKPYTFTGASGPCSLADLFGRHSQLIVSHFMFGPDWEAGCPSCSFWADGYNGMQRHLAARDIAFVMVSRAPLERLAAYRERMGWTLEWVSSLGSDFNHDYDVSFDPQAQERGQTDYNYARRSFPSSEAPGVSVFARGEDGTVFHTYSCFARGLDMLNNAYHLMDLVPKGRDEAALDYPMAWLRRHDEY